jgi:hypothetical protein
MKTDLQRLYSHLLALEKHITAEAIKNAYLGTGGKRVIFFCKLAQ